MAFFDPTRPSYRANPYPALAQLRRDDPVHWSAGLKAWVPTRYAECSEVLHDGRRFTTDPALTEGARAEAIIAHRASAPLGTVPTLGTTSGEAHRELRRIVNPVFAPAAVRKVTPDIVSAVGRLLERLPTGEAFDLMETFANPLPKQVMLGVMGFPETEADHLQRLLSNIEVARSNPRSVPATMAAARSAQAEAAAILEPHLAGGPSGETVLGALARSWDSGGGMGTNEVLSVAAHIATVVSDPTSGAIANAVAALATDGETQERLRREPRQVRNATHELLRYDSPAHITPRFAAVDTELAGKRVRRGDAVLAMVGAANRDPAAFPRPDEIDIERDARRQLGFGQGEHICLGAPLALAILESALSGLFRRFTRIELAAAPEYGPSIELRVPDRLLIRCE